MKRSLIASVAALGIIATPALATTPAKAPTQNAKLVKAKASKVASARVTKAAAKKKTN